MLGAVATELVNSSPTLGKIFVPFTKKPMLRARVSTAPFNELVAFYFLLYFEALFCRTCYTGKQHALSIASE